MDGEKFKVCPACGEHIPPARLECKRCETDLTGVNVVDEAALQARANESSATANNKSTDTPLSLKLVSAER
jgi:predicted amidophosphoribosyltransferase